MSIFLRKSKLSIVIVICLLSFWGCNNNPAALTTGTIQGQITNPAGDTLIVGATILTIPPTGAVSTDAQGRYTIFDVSPGQYIVVASKSGYSPDSVTIKVVAGKTTTADIHLGGNLLSAPTITSVTPDSAGVTVGWNTVNGATSYNLYYAAGTTVTMTTGTKVTGVVSPKQVVGLTNGMQYAFAVSAVNQIGESGLSGVQTATPQAPITLNIIQPPFYTDRVDTIHTDTIPVEGETTVGATIYIGTTDNPTTQVTVDNVGHFVGQIAVADLEGTYSVFVKAAMANHTPILESRSVYYKPLSALFPFTLDAQVDGSSFNAGASMIVTQIATNYYVDIKSTASGYRSLELLFIFPTNSTFPTNIPQTRFTGSYSESNNVTWSTRADSVGSATVTVNSFSFSAADTVFSAGFSFKAWGGAGVLTLKNITAGTVQTN